MFQNAFKDKRVLVTGHTGFKGTWLSWWLHRLGAKVTGLALDPPTIPSIFEQTRVGGVIDDVRGDVRDPQIIHETLSRGRFDFIFHLAAQPNVLDSYNLPAETYGTNVFGTLNLLEEMRRTNYHCVMIVCSTDKVYENRESGEPFAETDKLGGFDPYSSSKAAMEIVVASYRSAFFGAHSHTAVATVRAGNVIGGGDWQKNRIIPDIVRSLSSKQKTMIRNPESVRPWQHVLDPLSGYMELAARIAQKGEKEVLCSAWNFGPTRKESHTVGELATRAIAAWPGERRPWLNPPGHPTTPGHHEAHILKLSIAKAHQLLQWRPTWDFDTAVERTMRWYWASQQDPAGAARQTDEDIATFEQEGKSKGVHWATAAAAAHE